MKKKLVGLKIIGRSYGNRLTYGSGSSGWGVGVLDDGTEIYIPEEHSSKGMDAAHKYVESLGHDTREYRAKLDNWVKTGQWEGGNSQ